MTVITNYFLNTAVKLYEYVTELLNILSYLNYQANSKSSPTSYFTEFLSKPKEPMTNGHLKGRKTTLLHVVHVEALSVFCTI